MTETENNLKAAFQGNLKLTANIWRLPGKPMRRATGVWPSCFEAAAEAETIHAHNHLDALDGVKSTLENLREAYGGEHYEFTEMYPVFLTKSKEEKQSAATKTFHYAK